MCGTTRAEDAKAAVQLGVDALGFIFVKKSFRYVSEIKAYEIIRSLPPFISTVGVFVNSSMEQVKSTVEECGLTQVQLHGEETIAFCRELRNWNKSLSVCKAFRVGGGGPSIDFSSYEAVVNSILLDTYVKEAAGGTGLTFDWGLVDSLKLKKPVILAGGLNAENIRTAVRTVSPFCVDINSGVETSPGVKDYQKLKTVIQMVRAADNNN